MVYQEAVQTTTVHIEQLINQLKSSEHVETDARMRNTLFAAEEAETVWLSLQEEHAGKTKKLIKSFIQHLDYSMKHSTGGANQGYSLIMRHMRAYA